MTKSKGTTRLKLQGYLKGTADDKKMPVYTIVNEPWVMDSWALWVSSMKRHYFTQTYMKDDSMKALRDAVKKD